jgi:amidase
VTADLPLADRSVGEVRTLLDSREVSARELTDACLRRIERDGERLNTFLAVDAASARRAADAADAEIARGDSGASPLRGIPYALKDIFVTRALDDDGAPFPGGMPTTNPRRISVAVRVRCRGSASRGRRDPARQDELRRVRNGVEQREQRVWPGPEPVG